MNVNTSFSSIVTTALVNAEKSAVGSKSSVNEHQFQKYFDNSSCEHWKQSAGILMLG